MSKKYLFLGLLIALFITIPLFSGAQSSTDDIARQIAGLRQQIAELQQKLAQLQGLAGRQCFMFNRNLGVGASGRDVRELHAVLAKEGFPVLNVVLNSTAIESRPDRDDDDKDKDKNKNKKIENENNRTDRYTEATAAAVSAFQLKYKSEILDPNGLTAPTGYVGPATRAKLNQLSGCKNVEPPPSQQVYITPTSLPPAVSGQTYTQFLDVRGFSSGTGNISWSIISGALPNGFDLQKLPDPVVACSPGMMNCGGVPRTSVASLFWGRAENATPGTYTFTAQATNGTQTAQQQYTLMVRGANTGGNRPPTISGVSGPTTRNVGQTGTWTVNAFDPDPPAGGGTLSYSVIWGDESTMASGAVASPSATPIQQTATFTHTYSTAGTFTPTFTVTDNAGQSARASLSVVVGQNQTSPITVLTPNGGEQWVASSTRAITWRYDGATSATKVDLYLDNVCGSIPTCAVWPGGPIVLDKNISALSTYNWIVATDIVNNPIRPSTYRVRICDAESQTNCDSSDNYFTILPATQ